MKKALLKYDIRRLAPCWATGMLFLTAWFLLVKGPLLARVHDTIPAALFGMLIGARLMADTGDTQSFVFSRGVTRRGIVAGRIVLGLLSLLAATLMVWLLLSSSLRAGIHSLLGYNDAVYYPMVSSFEAQLATGFGLKSTAGLLFMVFMMIFRGLRDPELTTTAMGNLRLWLVDIPILMCSVFLAMSAISIASDYTLKLSESLLMWITLSWCALATLSGIISCPHLEANG